MGVFVAVAVGDTGVFVAVADGGTGVFVAVAVGGTGVGVATVPPDGTGTPPALRYVPPKMRMYPPSSSLYCETCVLQALHWNELTGAGLVMPSPLASVYVDGPAAP